LKNKKETTHKKTKKVRKRRCVFKEGDVDKREGAGALKSDWSNVGEKKRLPLQESGPLGRASLTRT